VAPVRFPPVTDGRGRALLFAGLGAIVVLLVVGVAWAVSPGSQGEEVDGEGSPSTTAVEPADDPGEQPGAGDEELDQVVAEIAAFVEEERGLEFEEDPVIELLDEGDFQDRLLEDEEEDEQEILDLQDELQALGLIDDDLDLATALDDLLGGAVLGFYDPETGELVVRAGEITPLARITIAHELTHALDDQHFELDRPEYDDADDSEVSSGFSSLVEGNASVVEDAYRETMSDDEVAEADEEEAELSGAVPDDIPLILLQILSAPYSFGPTFVETLLDDGGQEAVDAAFEAPPTTSEQFIFPDVYLAGEDAIEVPLPEAEGEVIYEGVFGALSLLLILGPEDPAVGQAIQGWGGDAYVVWREDDRTCARGTFVGDTDQDTQELADALTAWAADQDDAQVDPITDGAVTFTSCS
jgi:hypothetical protein